MYLCRNLYKAFTKKLKSTPFVIFILTGAALYSCSTTKHVPDGSYLLESEQKVQGIAPGQFAVVYDPSGSICYGSGIITGRKVETVITNPTEQHANG